MVKAIRHAGIVTEDLDASLHFYQDLLGLKIARQTEESGAFIDHILGLGGAKVTTVKMAAGDGQMVELLSYHSCRGKQVRRDINDTGLTHIAFTVDNLDSEYYRLRDKGVVFISCPQVSPDGYAKVAFCKAPEGTFIELVEVLS
jgi:glyoxylase I family protein